jgi:hypothetical protein
MDILGYILIILLVIIFWPLIKAYALLILILAVIWYLVRRDRTTRL